jgi:hypothetical protein
MFGQSAILVLTVKGNYDLRSHCGNNMMMSPHAHRTLGNGIMMVKPRDFEHHCVVVQSCLLGYTAV